MASLRRIADGEVVTACQQACPTDAIVFGDMNDPNSHVAQLKKEPANYALLETLNTRPRTTYLGVIRNPNSEINTALNYWEITAKLAGGYTFPWFSMSAAMEHRSGAPQAPQFQFTGGTTIRNLVVNTQPIGSIALPNTNLANIRFTRQFSLGRGRTIQARVDFFNVFNANFVTARNLREGTSYLVPSGIILPRILQIGASYKF